MSFSSKKKEKSSGKIKKWAKDNGTKPNYCKGLAYNKKGGEGKKVNLNLGKIARGNWRAQCWETHDLGEK